MKRVVYGTASTHFDEELISGADQIEYSLDDSILVVLRSYVFDMFVEVLIGLGEGFNLKHS